ncbi:MAG TPA: hypothetical protein ENI76_04560, partial [Ignavibacteria bacterium]|nr:hypothetical protein [Ignavibacteria bacterium]
MSEEFNHGCIMIEKEYAKNSILCIEQIFPILTAIEFSNLDILIISTKNSNDANKEIIPSLSIYKAKQSISNSATNFSELWRFISECSGVPIDTNTNKLLNGLLAYATRANFLISEFNEFRVAIL